MKKIAAAILSFLLVTSHASAAISPDTVSSLAPAPIISSAQPAPLHHERLAFANSCDDSIWKFSLIEALTCIISGQWPSDNSESSSEG